MLLHTHRSLLVGFCLDSGARCMAAPRAAWHIKAMPHKPTITEASLKALGQKRLAGHVLEACDRDDVLDKKVRMMLAAKDGGDALDAELGKRIKSLAGGRTFYDWRIAGDLVGTIDTIRCNAVDELGAKQSRAAAVRLWQLIDLRSRRSAAARGLMDTLSALLVMYPEWLFSTVGTSERIKFARFVRSQIFGDAAEL